MLYQIEVVPVPIKDQNLHTNSYTEIHISKIYVTSEIYITDSTNFNWGGL